MNIFYFNCPCCDHKINAIKILALLDTCKSVRDHQSFYCRSCNNRIGKAHCTKKSYYRLSGFLVGVYYLVDYICLYFDWAFYIFPFIYAIFYCMFAVLFVSTYTFSCHEPEEEIEREEVDEFYSPVENQRMDSSEKNIIKTIVAIPIILIIVAFVVLISIAVSSFFD